MCPPGDLGGHSDYQEFSPGGDDAPDKNSFGFNRSQHTLDGAQGRNRTGTARSGARGF